MSRPGSLRLGIDVGGTNTDAVILDAVDHVVASAKTPTSDDISSGITEALRLVLRSVDNATITHAMLGTTHATNAVLHRRDLRRTAVIRIGGPGTHAIPPLYEWPADLRACALAGATVVDGGAEMTGEPLAELNLDAVRGFLASVAGRAETVAVCGVFSPINADSEFAVASVVREELGPNIPISLGHEIGSLRLLERENATALNSCLVGVAEKLIRGFVSALHSQGIDAAMFLSANDGTLMGLDHAVRYPVLTIGSGPTNSMRGAALLTGITEALVIDIGGTSTDVGRLVAGFPRESTQPFAIGGIETNFRMPDLASIAIGGGTIIRHRPLRVGPDSVGHRIRSCSLVFGGTTPTLTDAAVAAGRVSLGDHPVPDDPELGLTDALAIADQLIEQATDLVGTPKAPLPLIAVGGGSILMPERLPGVASIHRPAHFDVANAIGAAMAYASGQVDRIYKLDRVSRATAVDEARTLAQERAIRAGADPYETQVVEIEEIPVAYLNEPIVRIRAKAAGPLAQL